jgi:hypothetical protein
LKTVFHFMQWLDFDVPLPSHLAPPPLRNPNNKMLSGLVQWEFEVLAREIVLNGDRHGKRSISSWNDVSGEINAIKLIENECWKGRQDGDVLYELVRIAHRQFPWQRGINQPHIARYARLYEHAGLDEMVRAEYGMSHAEMLQLSVSLTGHFLNAWTVSLPLRNELNSVPPDVCNAFVSKFSLSLSDLREEYRKNASYGINWAYSFNPLRSRPLIRLSDHVAICPITTFLLRRATSEMYYDLVKDQTAFAKNFGPAVQELVGEVAKRSNRSGRFTVIPEARYGPSKAPKDTVDWIIEDQTATLFVECKGARVRYQGVSDLTDRHFIDAEFDRIRSFALQLYKTLNDALRGAYPNWKPRGTPVYPMIVTLEDWQTFGIHVDRIVIAPLKSELAAAGIDPAIVEKHPPSFCAMETFEMAAGVCDAVGVETVFGAKTKGEEAQWALETFLMNNFRAKIDALPGSVFADQWHRLLRKG